MKLKRYCRERLKDDIKRLEEIQGILKERQTIKRRMAKLLRINRTPEHNWKYDDILIEMSKRL